MLPRANSTSDPCEFRRTEKHVCGGVHRADSGDLRAARLGAKVGRAAMSYDNLVGLVLAVLIALFLFAALLFAERF